MSTETEGLLGIGARTATSTFTQFLSSACNNNSNHFLVLYLPKGEHMTFCKTNNSVNYKHFAFPSHHSHSPAWVHRKNVTAREKKMVFSFVFRFCCFLWGEAGGGGGGGERRHGNSETPLPTILLNQFYEL